jgi:hypothetical protein
LRGWSDAEMPVLRYFIVVGTALLVLLFAANAYLPKLPADNVNTAANAVSDLSVIRIHSVQKWPERVEFDTSVPPFTAPAAVLAANNAPADATAPARMRDAFAQLQPSQMQTSQAQTSELQTPEPKKPQLKLPPKRRVVASKTVTSRTIANNRIGPPMMLVAQQPHFGLFPNTIW